MPMQDEDMTTAEVITPVAKRFITFKGNVDAGKFVEHINIRGLNFYYTNWTLPEKGYAYNQAAVHISPNTPYHAAI